MTALDDQITIAVRGWLLEATGLDGSRIRPADDSGTRPDLPYITIQIILQGVEENEPEKIASLNADDEIVENISAQYSGTVQLDAYGRGGDELLTMAAMSLRLTKIRQYLAEQMISLQPEGGINDISILVDDDIEKRYTRDLAVHYSLVFTDDIEGVTALDEVEFDLQTD